ncbi:Scr1 family TA system antitoxin-like transcriptional regulator [Amycolatopsis azurea]|uniref:Scr1 family TA system antitoxin-like transcriptional regulator n=1 Tax=Amycolatopsis azurea TaxID=36819 RepID=UPI00382A89E6
MTAASGAPVQRRKADTATTMESVDRVRAEARMLCEAEEQAVSIRGFGGFEVPHLVRADAYARRRWVWAAQHKLWRPAADAVVELLPRRQALVNRCRPVRMSLVVSEGAIIALENETAPDTAVAQLRYLRDLTREPAHCVRILHYGTRVPWAPGPAFTIVTDPAGHDSVFCESLTPNDFTRVRDERRRREVIRHFTAMNEVCFDQARSRDRIDSAIQYCQKQRRCTGSR